MIKTAQGIRSGSASAIRRIGFLVLDEFPMVTLSCAIDTLRTANQLSNSSAYTWTVITPTGAPAQSSDGATRVATTRLSDAGQLDLTLVCAGANVATYIDKPVVEILHQMAFSNVALGGLGTGAYALAKAGLLDGYRCAIQWDDKRSLRAIFPNTTFLNCLSVIDRDRMSCAGGIAPIELMLSLVGLRLGSKMSALISSHVGAKQLADIGGTEARDSTDLPSSEHRALARIVSLMQSNLEEPLSARRLAALSGVSLRQVQRMFPLYYGTTLTSYYLRLRLAHAREQVIHSSHSLTEIAVSCGFTSPAHFSRSYRTQYGKSPSADRPRRWTAVGTR